MNLVKAIRRLVRPRRKDLTGGDTMGVPAFWFARALEIGGQERLNEPYKLSVWVQSAIAKIAGPVASVPICFFRPSREVAGLKFQTPKSKLQRRNTKKFLTSMGIVRRAMEDQIDLPEMDRFLRKPVPGLGYGDFVEASVGWYCMAGEWFWALPSGSRKPFPDAKNGGTQIVILRPDHLRHVIENGQLEGWQYRDQEGGQSISFLPDDLIQEKRWNPYNKWRGLAAFESARIAAEADWLAGKMTKNVSADNDAGGFYIIAKNGVPDDAQRQQILDDLRAKRDARQRGDPRDTFLTGDIEVKREELRSVDSNFVAMRLNSREEIYSALGVPPSLSQVKASYSIGSASDFYQLITTTCVPMGEKFCDAIERLTYLLTGQEVECLLDWDDHPVMQEVRKERYASVDTFWAKGVPMETIDEMLGLEMPDYPGKEIGWLPISVMPAEQAAMAPSEDSGLAENPNSNPDSRPSGQPPENNPSSNPDETPAVKEMLGVLKGSASLRRRLPRSKALWEGHMRRRAGTVRLIEGKVGKVLAEFRKTALAKLSVAQSLTKNFTEGNEGNEVKVTEKSEAGIVTKSLIDFIFDPKKFGERLKLVLQPVLEESLQKASDDLRQEELGFRDPWKFPPHEATTYVNGRKQAIMGVGGTVRDQLNTQLQAAYEKGEGIEDISDRVRGVFTSLSKGEAERVARTETGMAFNFARHEAAAASGVKYKRWLSSHGPNVRPAHEAAEEEDAIPLDEPFNVGGEQMMHPGDDSLGASAGNIINCQCIEIMVAPGKDQTLTEGNEDNEED